MHSPFIHTMRVRFRDTDVQGHVYFGTYFEFCDEAYSAYMRAIGVPWQEMVRSGTDMFYASATCDYLGSARFEDTIHVEARISKIGNTSITIVFVIRNDKNETLAKATLTSVCVDPQTREKRRVPDTFREAVAAFERSRVHE
ncbi:MAG: acyl-CoA thioesterase [Deltaproteobacteria bacterium]|nr:acyl-CoA thioesterase [Deltaproteobacteria bacterium]